MTNIRYKPKAIVAFVVGIILIYLTVRIRQYTHIDSINLKNVKAHDAWDFVADFSNMKYLNPTIVQFSILSESGNYANWQYRVEYRELLSHWPHLTNDNVADFDIHSSSSAPAVAKIADTFFINSTHRTCMLRDLICLNSKSVFTFTQRHDSTTDCEESVQYECPAVFFFFCRREVEHQRKYIMTNLSKHFAMLRNKRKT